MGTIVIGNIIALIASIVMVYSGYLKEKILICTINSNCTSCSE